MSDEITAQDLDNAAAEVAGGKAVSYQSSDALATYQQIEEELAAKAAEKQASEAAEAAAEPEPVKAKAPEVKSPGFGKSIAELMQQEKARRESLSKHREAQARVPELEAETQKLLALAKHNPIAFLEAQGVTLDSLNAMKTEQDDPFAQMRTELQQMRDYITRQEEEKVRTERESRLEGMRSSVEQWVAAQDNFPLTKAWGAGRLVAQVIEDAYATDGRELSDVEAAEVVEGHIKERLAQVAKTNPDLIRSLLPQVEQAEKAKSATLTNNIAAASSRNVTEEDDLLAMLAAALPER